MKTYPLLQSQLGVFYDCMKFPQVMQYNVPCITPLSDNPDLVTLLRPLMAYNMSGSHQMRWIESTNDYTTQVLYRLGFQWPPHGSGLRPSLRRYHRRLRLLHGIGEADEGSGFRKRGYA